MTLWLRIGLLVRLPLYDLFLINLIGLFFCTRLKFSIIKNIPLIRYYKPDFNILAHSTWFSIILEFLVRSCTDRGILISYFVGTIFTLFFFFQFISDFKTRAQHVYYVVQKAVGLLPKVRSQSFIWNKLCSTSSVSRWSSKGTYHRN